MGGEIASARRWCARTRDGGGQPAGADYASCARAGRGRGSHDGESWEICRDQFEVGGCGQPLLPVAIPLRLICIGEELVCVRVLLFVNFLWGTQFCCVWLHLKLSLFKCFLKFRPVCCDGIPTSLLAWIGGALMLMHLKAAVDKDMLKWYELSPYKRHRSDVSHPWLCCIYWWRWCVAQHKKAEVRNAKRSFRVASGGVTKMWPVDVLETFFWDHERDWQI